MKNEISGTDDVFDIRDAIAEFEELRDERQSIAEDYDGEEPNAVDLAKERLAEWDKENPRFKLLGDFLEEVKGYGGDEQWEGDWYPVTFIRDSYFTEYAEELCKDIGDLPKDIPHYIEIDWEATARNIRVDYSAVDFEGFTFWYR